MKNENGNQKPRRGRCDSILRRLPPEQRDQVDAWLFDKRLPYDAVAEKCVQHFNVSVSTSSISRYCQSEGKRPSRPRGASVFAADPGGAYVKLLENLNHALLKAAQNLDLNSADPDAIAKLTGVLIAARHEADHALRASTIREKFEFDAATACLIHQTRVKSVAEDESLDDTARIQKIREELFGPNLPA